ncbi:MAG TPA: histidine kinase [Solirubrobacteraceae bacterium]|nr:histidine kinase [Solirubrobacteraceae bacterium]
MTDSQLAPSLESERVAEARARAQERLHRQRATLRPLGWAVILVVVLGSANGHPAPGLHGKAMAVTLALCVFAASLLVAIRDGFPERGVELQAAVIAVMGAAGVAIAGLQLKGATSIAAGVAVFMAITRLPLRVGVAIGATVTVALAAATAIAGSSASAVAAATLVTVLLGVVAQFLKQSRQSQDQTQLLLAQLQDARDEQARAAAIAERSRIAGELHDVLAHSLSGAAIQLQGARKLADREHATPTLSDAIDRASELVKGGLDNARQAVGALRGDPLPTVAQLPSLIASYRTDMKLDVTLRIEGDSRTLPADPSLALYRGAQEALTNVSRYAPSACTTVVLRYEGDRTRLSVNNGPSAAPPREGMGGGRGLNGLRERIERTGGTMSAGPTAEGWRVEIEVPA